MGAYMTHRPVGCLYARPAGVVIWVEAAMFDPIQTVVVSDFFPPSCYSQSRNIYSVDKLVT